MNEEEKKAIEILDTFELRRKTKNYKEISLEDTQSVKIVLNLIEKLQKENEELEEINNELEAEKNEAIRRYNFETIPIKKVKDKISERQFELQQEYEDFEDDSILRVLQELIEEREEK